MPASSRRASFVRRRVTLVALVVYALAGVWLVFGPSPGDEAEAVGRGVRAAGSVASGQRAAAEPSGDDTVVLGLDDEAFSNVLLLVPLPVLAALAWPRRRWWLAVPAGIALSGAIEAVQLVVLDHRSPSWEDVRHNSVGVLAGGVLGLAVAGWLRRLGARRRRRPAPSA